MLRARSACATAGSSSIAILRETTTLPRRRLIFRILTGISWPDELIEIVNRPNVDLRSRHERGHADIHHQSALGALDDVAGDQQLIAHGLFESVPDAQAAGLGIGQQDVAFRLRTVRSTMTSMVSPALTVTVPSGCRTARWEPGLRACIRNRR